MLSSMATLAASSVANKPVEQEFEAMFREHYQMVYQTARSILGNSADAEDVLQSIFLRLIRREVPPESGTNVKGYFYRAAVNAALSTIRSKRRYELVGNPERFEAVADLSDSKSAEETHRRLIEAIAELNPAAAQILVLRYVHDYSDSQIAKLLGTSRSAIAVRLFRSRARLKKLLHDLGEE
jgi:RNA polymerase sigma-70 factor (ECF subfamily)